MTREQLENALLSSGFVRLTGMRITSTNPAASSLNLRMPFSEHVERTDGSGQFHGGAVASLIDTAACFVLGMLGEAPPPTINLRTDYLRPAVGEALNARATVRRAGRTVALVDVDVEDASGRLVAVGRGSFLSGGAG